MDSDHLHQRFDTMIELIDSWLWETDVDGKFTWFSDNVERLVGVNPTWHYGKKRTDILAESNIDQRYLQEHLHCVEQQKSFKKFVYSRKGPNGDTWLSIDGDPCFDENNTFIGYRGCGTVVTEQRLTETHQLQLIEGLNTINQGLLLFDSKERLVFINQQTKRFFGIDESTSVAKPGIKFTELIESQLNRGIIEDARGREEAWLKSRIDAFRFGHEPIFHYLSSGKRLRIDHYRTKAGDTIVTVQDIGALLEAEQQIKTTQNLLLTAIDGYSGGVALYDNDGHLLITNQRYAEFYPELDQIKIGDKFEDLLRRRLAAKGIPMAIGREEEWLADRLALFNDPGETVMDVEYPCGKWVQVREQRTPDGIFRTLTDISHSKKLELKLQASEERFKDFAECAADVFWECDVNLNYNYIDGRFDELLGLSENALIGKPLTLTTTPGIQFVNPGDARIKRHLKESLEKFEEIKFTHFLPDGSFKVLSNSGKALLNSDGEVSGYRGILTDITESYQLNLKLHHQANHDDLTNLVNRRSFKIQLDNALERSLSENIKHVLCYVDLDQFKIVNDSAGHLAGDHLLKRVANLLKDIAGDQHVCARIGGDEFGILLFDCNLEHGSTIAEQMVNELKNYRFSWKGRSYQIGGSVGMVEINTKSQSAEQIMIDADLACYTAKDLGRNRAYAFSSDDPGLIQRRAEFIEVNEIHDAMREEGRLKLYCQPIVAIDNAQHNPKRFELLLRVFDRQGDMRLPGLFISAAERFNLMTELDQWVIRHAFDQFRPILENDSEVQISINLSGSSISDPVFHEFVEHAFLTTGCPANQICFEITETAAIENLNEALNFIAAMKSHGCKFALDDFGSGLSSLAQLERLPIDYVKIDGCIIEKLVSSKVNQAIVTSICNIANIMNIEVVGEYVETNEILNLLDELGVHHAQGYLFGKPGPMEQLCLDSNHTALSAIA